MRILTLILLVFLSTVIHARRVRMIQTITVEYGHDDHIVVCQNEHVLCRCHRSPRHVQVLSGEVEVYCDQCLPREICEWCICSDMCDK